MVRSQKAVGIAAFVALGLFLGGSAVHAMAGAGGGSERGNGERHGGRHPMRALLGGGGQSGSGAKGVRGERVAQFREKLNLSDEQREAIREAIKSHREELRSAFKPVMQARRELRAAVGAESIDEASIKAKSAALAEAIANASLTVAKTKHDVAEKAKFTSEQKDLLREAKAKIQEAADRAREGKRGERAR